LTDQNFNVIILTKAEARKTYLQKRKNITDKEKLIWDDLVLIQFQKIAFPPVSLVFSYIEMPHQKEVKTESIINFLEFKNPNLRVAYPVCNFQTWTMDAVIGDENTSFIENRFGTIEPDSNERANPKEIDLVIVPLLCFDQKGYRVGYGKGFYDKYLRETNSDTLKIGLSYFAPIEKILDSDEFDIPLDYCITPGNIYEF